MSSKRFESACLSGVEQAFKFHYSFTGGLSLSAAPESFIQVNIFRMLAKELGVGGWVTMEESVQGLLKEGGAERRGCVPRNKHGRIDIVTWWKSGKPRLLIEVKKVYAINSLGRDVRRLGQVLNRGGTTRHGLVVAYAEAKTKKTLETRFNAIAQKSRTKISQLTPAKRFETYWHDETKYWYWQAACFSVLISDEPQP